MTDRTGRFRAQAWTGQTVLKRDVFSSVERGLYAGNGVAQPAVKRALAGIPVWTWPLGFLLMRRERRALRHLGRIEGAPALLAESATVLVRSWVDGVALHLAKPYGDRAFFASARRLLRRLHRAGVTHNDLAKEQNWLRGPDGRAAVTDFQLATVFRKRGRLARIAAYEDLRHLLKHKRRYCPEALTAREQRILARKSGFARLWMATFKKVYIKVTRNVLRFTDREGGGPRLVFDAPVIVERLKSLAGVRDAAVVAFPHRGAGTGLYVFVEADAVLPREAALAALPATIALPPEFIQTVAALPRDAAGAVRLEVLQLIATNQVDLLDALPIVAAERERLAPILAGRLNLTDRFNYS